MYVSIYNIQGKLAAPLSKTSGVMILDQETTANLVIAEGQHTYLALDNGLGIEIVKVWGKENNKFYIDRALDSTEAQSHTAGTRIYYTLTQAEIESHILYAPLEITPKNGIVVENNTVGYTDLDVQIIGNLSVIGQNKFIRLPEYGCCDGSNSASQIIPKPYWYTSPLYPVDYDEPYTVTYTVRRMNSYGMPKDEIALTYSLLNITVRNILHKYIISDNYNTRYSLSAGTLRDILKPYVVPVFPPNPNTGLPSKDESEAIVLNYSFIVGNIKTLQVRHDLPSDIYRAQYSLLSGSLV